MRYKFILIFIFQSFSLISLATSKKDSLISIIESISITNSTQLGEIESLILECKKYNFEKGILKGITKASDYYTINSSKVTGANYLLQKINEYEAVLSDVNISTLQNDLGWKYLQKAEYLKSQIWLFKSLKIREKNQLDTLLIGSYGRIGILYGLQKKDSLSVIFFKKQLEFSSKLDFKNKVYSALLNLGVTYRSLGDFILSKDYLLQSLTLCLENDLSKNRLSRTYHNLGWVYENMENFDSSKHYYSKSIKIKKLINSNKLEDSYNNLGYIFLKEHTLDSASKYLSLAEIYAEKNNNRQLSRKIYANISELHQKKNDYSLAYKYLYQYDTLNQSIFNETKSRQIAELQTKYETEKKDKELLLRQAKIDLTTAEKNRLMYILLVSVLFTFIIIYIYTQRQKAVKKLRKKEAELHTQEVGKLIHEQELKSINAMLEGEEKERKRIAEDLHDRVGSMLSAMRLHLESSNTKAVELLDDTANEVRRISHNLETKVLNRFGLIAALEDLAEKIESSEKIHFELHHLDLDERLDSKLEINVYRIIQELISNTLKHSKATEIIVQANRIEDQLIISVEDDGIGFNSLEVKNTGMGLSNIVSRANELNGEMNIDSGKGKGTIITVEIPL